MAYEQREGQGSLFKNDRKETDKHPDYTGSVTIGGKQYWLSGWIKEFESGKKWLSLAAKPKDAPAKKQTPQKPAAEEMDDEIPF